MPAKTPTSPTPDQRPPRPGSVRAFVGAPTSVDETTRSFDIVITTETPVRRCLPDPRQPVPIADDMDASYIETDEVLVAAGVDLSRAPRMPLSTATTPTAASRRSSARSTMSASKAMPSLDVLPSHASMPICCRTSSTDISDKSRSATITTAPRHRTGRARKRCASAARQEMAPD